MPKGIDYRALFDAEVAQSLRALTRELEDLLAVRPAPRDYRESLRSQLLAAANDDSFYARSIPRQVIVAMLIVVSVLLAIIVVIGWRADAVRARRVVSS